MGAKARRRLHTQEFGKIVVELRTMAHWTQGELAARVGMERRRLGKIERGERNVYYREVIALLGAFEDAGKDISGFLIGLPDILRDIMVAEIERWRHAER